MRIQVTVPATSANVGPGFDCLGLALDRFELTVVLQPGGSGRRITVDGYDAEKIAGRPADNLVVRALEAAWQAAGHRLDDFHLHIHNQIPLARGLGSSSAAIIGGLLAANAWLASERRALSDDRIAELAVELEGHSDNVMAALLGGLTVSVAGERGVFRHRVPTPDFPAIALIVPDHWQPTHSARGLLPATIPHEDGVYNVGRVAMLLSALSSGRFEALREAMSDRLHETYRQVLYPWLPEVRRAALDAGAYGVSLSGSGPSILALCPPLRVDAVTAAMLRVMARADVIASGYQAQLADGASVQVGNPDIAASIS